jgi:hypothetical protein
MWTALFQAISAGFGFFGSLLSKRNAPSTTTTEEPIDAASARAGTAAGTSAFEASKYAGKRGV